MGEIAFPNPIAARGVTGRARPSRGLWPRLIALAVAAALTGWGLAATLRSAPPAVEADGASNNDMAAVANDWIAISRPVALYGVDAPDLATSPRAYAARRRARSGEREDILTFGAFAAGEFHLSLRFHRRGAEPPPPASLFVQTARHAGESGHIVARMERSSDMASKLGPVEMADATITADGRERPCIALRFGLAGDALEATGFACGTDASPMDRARLTCLVDRIALLAPGEDRAIRQAFAEAERRPRSDCGSLRRTR